MVGEGILILQRLCGSDTGELTDGGDGLARHCFNIYLHFYKCRIHLTSILGGGGVFIS